MVPSPALPEESSPLASNNNVDIELFNGRLYLAWRTGPTHFASADARMEVISSGDSGQTWRYETTFAVGRDVREPRFYQINNTLFFSFFEAGINVIAFEPKALWRSQLMIGGEWSEPVIESEEKVVVWDVKLRSGSLFRTSYVGDHYTSSDLGGISVLFETSKDGILWTAVGDGSEVIFGGVSEVAFEFLADGSLVAVGRVEDKDPRGMGSLVCTAPASSLGDWECADMADPERYDSPELFRHGSTIYMAARRDPDGTFGPEGDFLAYSTRPKRSALYRVDPETLTVSHIEDFPGVGDTAFPAIRRLSEDAFLMANYTSPLDNPDVNWLDVQVSDKGTRIYLTKIQFSAP